jgi:hypothetical protein
MSQPSLVEPVAGCPGRDRTPKFPITLPPLKSLANFRQKSRFAPWRLFRLFAVQSGVRRRRHLRYDGLSCTGSYSIQPARFRQADTGNATSEEGSNSRSLIEPISTLTTPENGNANRRQSEISIAGLPDGKEVPELLSGISVVSSEVDSNARANPLSLHKRTPSVQLAKSAPCHNLDIDWRRQGIKRALRATLLPLSDRARRSLQ